MFKAEYAKSNKSSCRRCKERITRDSLRLAYLVQSSSFGGKIPIWFHYKCFWSEKNVKDPEYINGFHTLRWEDQEKIKTRIEEGSDAEDAEMPVCDCKDFAIEYAKSSRSSCRSCEKKIDKNVPRLSKKDRKSKRAWRYGPQDQWYHLECFDNRREKLGFRHDMNIEEVDGFEHLNTEDQEELVKTLGKGDRKPKKRKFGDTKRKKDAKKAKRDETAEETVLREQNDLLWGIRDELVKHVSIEAMKEILEFNDQKASSGKRRIIDATADMMAFGALEKCEECENGQLYYSWEGYRCAGNLTDWTRCTFVTKTPQRKAVEIPEKFKDDKFLKEFEFEERERLFPSRSVRVAQGPASSSIDTTDGGLSSRNGSSDSGPSASVTQSLENMRFVLIGRNSKTKSEMRAEIKQMGGTVVSRVDQQVAAVISNKYKVQKKPKTISDAEKLDVHVVSDEFLDDVKKGKSLTKTLSSTVKMKVKGAAAVDPDSGLEDAAHVIEDNGHVYNAVLGMVDVLKGTNAFYKIQALEDDLGSGWWVFRAWGRVGTTIGGKKLQKCDSQKQAKRKFNQLYFEKTSNRFYNNDFKKHPGKFYPLDIDYGQDDAALASIDQGSSRSQLHKELQDLVCLIFDVESMKDTMMEFEIDLSKMPLGKLSKRQIESAYSVLTELQQLLEKGGTPSQFLDASNRFYTLIPHDFGMKKPLLLDTAQIIKSKTEMLDNLLEIEVAYSMLKGGDDGEDPIDAHYKKLKCKLEPMDKTCKKYKRLVKYTAHTHTDTYDYDLEVLDIFKVSREGEKEIYEPYKDFHNRQLLWHGSRVTNFAGILSQGLRIAPKEAPVSGYMFGKGIYFADMVTKSADYCRTSKSNPIGLLLLCEVALGDMYTLTSTKFISDLPPGKHSVKGVGETCPNPKGTKTTSKGVAIPMGKGTHTRNYSGLEYNEYIVYDVAQVNIKYLLKTKFKHKW